MGRSVPSRAMRTVELASPTIVPSRRARRAGFSAGSRVSSLTMWKTSGSGPALRLGLGPAGQGLGHGVHERDPALGVGADHRVADAGERHPQPVRLLAQRLLGALAGQHDAPGVLQRDGTQPFLLVVPVRHHPPPRTSAASAVPCTRARILANAVSRLVVVSSQNGENPQSSQVPELLDRDVLRRLQDAVADLLRRLDARVDRVDHAHEHPLARLEVLADDLAGPGGGPSRPPGRRRSCRPGARTGWAAAGRNRPRRCGWSPGRCPGRCGRRGAAAPRRRTASGPGCSGR